MADKSMDAHWKEQFINTHDIPKEAFNLWIHCNKCFESFPRKRLPLFLLSCNHVLCQSCLQPQQVPEDFAELKNTPAYKCPLCKKIARSRQLGHDMPIHLKELFNPNPCEASVSAERVENFQISHRQHIMKHMESLHEKFRKKERLLKESHNELKNLMEEHTNLKQERLKLERRVRVISKKRRQQKALQLLENKKTKYNGSIITSSANEADYPKILNQGVEQFSHGRGGVRGRFPRRPATVSRRLSMNSENTETPLITHFENPYPYNSFPF